MTFATFGKKSPPSVIGELTQKQSNRVHKARIRKEKNYTGTKAMVALVLIPSELCG
jgi:hypothetical protein